MRKSRNIAFETLYCEHYPFVWRCLRRLGVHAETEDATQEVFITAYRRLHTFEGRGSIRGWLAGIARRIAFRSRRTCERRRRRHEALDPPLCVDDVEGWLRRKEAAVFLDAFLDSLHPDKRTMFVLCELEGLQGREAARALGLNPNTAYARLRAARASFRRACATAQAQGFDSMASRTRGAHRESPPARAIHRGWAAFVTQTGHVGAVTHGAATSTSLAWTWGGAKAMAGLVVFGVAGLGLTRVTGSDAGPKTRSAVPIHGAARSDSNDVFTGDPLGKPPSEDAEGVKDAEHMEGAEDVKGAEGVQVAEDVQDATVTDPAVGSPPGARSPVVRRRAPSERAIGPAAARRRGADHPQIDPSLTGPEYALLARASTAYGGGRADEATALAEALLTEYPDSVLTLDARVLLVKAQCALERYDRAAAAARGLPAAERDRLLRQHCRAGTRDHGMAETTTVQ